MSEIAINGSNLGTALQNLLMCDELSPGSEPSYEVAKCVYLYHPLGSKIVDTPIQMAQSQPRTITIPGAPEERLREVFEREWNALKCSETIANGKRISRIYGSGTIIMGEVGKPSDVPIPPERLSKADLFFNVLDPLNTSGSIGYDQNPNSPTFQRPLGVTVSGQSYHPSRALVMYNEAPVYIAWTSASFGYVGRSVYQRALFPLKSFVQSMITDDLVTKKAGVLVAMMKAAGSIVDRFMEGIAGIKRNLLKEAQTTNVLTIEIDEKIETLDMQNVDKASSTARKNILENIAAATPMPAIMLNSQTFAEGFGEGTEDAKTVARFIDGIRIEMNPAYAWFDNIVQHRAWSPEFYATLQADFSEKYGKVDYKTAFYEWVNAFKAEWPSLLTEPDSEKVKVEDVKLKGIIAWIEVLLPNLDPENKAAAIQWANDMIAENKLMFPQPLLLDYQALIDYVPPAPAGEDGADGAEKEPTEPKPFAAAA
jgi:hypothetical protein